MLEFLFQNAYIIILVIIGLTTFLGKMKQPTNNQEGERTPPKPTGSQMPSFGESDHHRQPPQVHREQPGRSLDREVAGDMRPQVTRPRMISPSTVADNTSIYSQELTGHNPMNTSTGKQSGLTVASMGNTEPIDADQARKGMMWAEIFGPPKAKQWQGQPRPPYKRN